MRAAALLAALVLAGCEAATEPDAPEPAPDGDWAVVNLLDEFGEPAGRVARSRWEKSIQPLGFPFQDLRAVVLVACDEPWFRFDPAFLDEGFGLDAVEIRARMDGVDIDTWYGDKGGSTAQGDDVTIRRTYHRAALEALKTGSRFAIGIELAGDAAAAFEWSLDGAAAAKSPS